MEARAQYSIVSGISKPTVGDSHPFAQIGPMQNMMPKSSSVIDSDPLRINQQHQQKAARDLGKNLPGGTRQNSHPTTTQALQSRLVDTSALPQNQRITRQQAASHGSTKAGVQEQLRSQNNNSQMSQHYYQNNRNHQLIANSDWEMLALIGKQSKQLKTAQYLNTAPSKQDEIVMDQMLANENQFGKQPHTNSSSVKNSSGPAVQGLPGINAIKHGKNVNAAPQFQQNASSSFVEFDPSQIVSKPSVSANYNQASIRQSQQMISTNAQPSQSMQPGQQKGQQMTSSLGGLNNIRLTHPGSQPTVPPQQQFLQNQQKSIAKLDANASKKMKKLPISSNQTQNAIDTKTSSSRGFLKQAQSTTNQQQSARMQQQHLTGAGINKVKSASTAATQNTGYNLTGSGPRTSIFPPGGKMNGSLLLTEAAIHGSAQKHMAQQVTKGSPQQAKPYSDLPRNDINVGSHSNQKRISNESLPLGVQLLNRYYQSGADKMNSQKKILQTTNSLAQNGASAASGSGSSQAHAIKQLAVKNNNISKTSIELEYSKFDYHQKRGGGGVTKSHMPVHQVGGNSMYTSSASNQQSRKNLLHHSNERGTAIQTSHFYQQQQQRSTADSNTADSDMTSGKHAGQIRFPHQQLQQTSNGTLLTAGSNNQGGASATLGKQRKIESALAQSAINAIQNHHGGMLQIPTNGHQQATNSVKQPQLLKFEQKAYSQPMNQLSTGHQAQQFNYMPSAQGKPMMGSLQASKLHEHDGDGRGAPGSGSSGPQPPFIMRNNLNKSGEQINNNNYAQMYAAQAAANIVSSDYSYHYAPSQMNKMDYKSGSNITAISSALNTSKTTQSGAASGQPGNSSAMMAANSPPGSGNSTMGQRTTSTHVGLISSKF